MCNIICHIYWKNTSTQTLKCFTDLKESWLERNIICIFEQGTWGIRRVSNFCECRKALPSICATRSSLWLHLLNLGRFWHLGLGSILMDAASISLPLFFSPCPQCPPPKVKMSNIFQHWLLLQISWCTFPLLPVFSSCGGALTNWHSRKNPRDSRICD